MHNSQIHGYPYVDFQSLEIQIRYNYKSFKQINNPAVLSI